MAGAQGVQNLRGFLDAFMGGELERARTYWSDDAVFHMSGNHRLAGDYSGGDRLLAVMGEMNAAVADLQAEPLDILADDRYMAMIVRLAGERDGKAVHIRTAVAYRVDDDGKLAEAWHLADDQAAFDRIFGY